MLNLIQKYWGIIIVVIATIFVIIFFSRLTGCNTPKTKYDTTTKHIVKVDTTYKDSLVTLIQYAVKTTQTIKASKERLDSFSQASKSYDSLLGQYNDLKQDYLSYNKHKDSISLPNNGYVKLEDIISKNTIVSRTPTIFSRDKTITIHDSVNTTIKITNPPNRQVYIGGEITGNQVSYLNGANAILGYKDRNDRFFQLKGGLLNYDGKVTPQFGAGLLWKIKLHK